MSSSSSAASNPIASKSRGMSGASVRPGSRMNVAASSFNAASASQVRLKDAFLGGLKEKQRGDLPHERQENSGETDDSESEPWYFRLLLKRTKLVETTSRRISRSRVFRISEKSKQ